MINKNKRVVSKICLLVGLCLLIVAVVLFGFWQWRIYSSKQQTKALIETIYSLIPEPQGSALEQRSNNEMSVLSLDGVDFVGTIEMPRYDLVLPVCANWGNTGKYPCRFDGSIYNGTMQIGATSQKGQYDFYREIEVNDTVLFTDMEGNSYTYSVKDLRYARHVNKDTLGRQDAALTLFIKNVYDFEYLIVFCDVLN